jgi:hypothetical protein
MVASDFVEGVFEGGRFIASTAGLSAAGSDFHHLYRGSGGGRPFHNRGRFRGRIRRFDGSQWIRRRLGWDATV